MTRKIISLFIALLMVFSLAMPTLAVSEENQKLSEAEVQQALDTAVSALVDAPEGSTVIVDEKLAQTVEENADTPAEVSGLLSGLLFIEKDKADGVAAEIVENSVYTVKVIADGKQTVYCSVDFEKYPEIFDARVYILSIEKIRSKCDEVAKAEGVDIDAEGYAPMNYSHIAGELALHMILADLSRDTASWNPLSQWIYERSSVADLNVDEARFPSELLEIFGDIVVNLMNIIITIFG